MVKDVTQNKDISVITMLQRTSHQQSQSETTGFKKK